MSRFFYFRFFSRCIHPGQQHGRRLPSASSVCARSTRRCLVSMSFAPSTQQIHSLRARGVISFQAARLTLSASKAVRRSAGSLWTVPVGIAVIIVVIVYQASSWSTTGSASTGILRIAASRSICWNLQYLIGSPVLV